MGTFAVLNAGQDFIVRSCHLNLWCLRGLLLRRVFYWDVGLRIQAGGKPVQELEVLLPFGTDKKSLSDITDAFADSRTVRIVFGKRGDVGGGGLVLDNELVERLALELSNSRLNKDDSEVKYSRWLLRFASPLEPGTQGYVRARFEIRDRARMWEWKRPLLFRNGAQVDIRVCDFRELVAAKNWLNHERRIVDLQELNVFVVMPATYQLRAASPGPRYTRLLESDAWGAYIGRATSIAGRKRLLTYAWRNKDGQPVNANARFRAFLEVAKDPGWDTLPNLVAGALMTALVFWALFELRLRLEWPKWLTVAVILAAITTIGGFIVGAFPVLAPVANWFRRRARSLDKWFYKP